MKTPIRPAKSNGSNCATRSRRTILASSAAALLALTVFSPGTRGLAAPDNWTGTTNANWNTATNWSGGLPISTSQVAFPGAIPGTGATITLGAGELADTLSFANSFTLNGGNLTLTTGNVDVTSGATATISSVLAGAGSLTKTSAGTLILSGANTYTGNTNLNAGTLIANSNTAFGNGGALVISGGTTVGTTVNGTTIVNPVTVNGDFTVTAGGGNFILNGPMSLQNAVRTITGTGNQDQPQFNGVISNGPGAGSGGLTFATANLPAGSAGNTPYVAFIMAGSAANTYTGLTTVGNGAYLVFNSAAANKVNGNVLIQGNGVVDFLGAGGTAIGGDNQIATNVTVTVNSPGSTILGGTAFQGLELQNNSQTIATLNGSAAGTIGIGAGTLTVNSGNFAGTILNTLAAPLPAGSPRGGLTVAGPGTFTLSGANTFTGPTNVNAGTLTVTNAAGLGGTTAVTVAAPATLNYIASADAQLALTGTLTLNGGSTLGGSIGAAPGSTAAIQVTGAVTAAAGNVAVNVYGAPGVTTGASGTYTLVNAPAGGLTANGTNYVLGNVYNNTNFTFGGLASTDNTVTATITAATPLTAAFWKGGLAGSPNVWAISNGATASNWGSDINGTATALVPGAGTDVTVSATGATNQGNMVLGAPMTVKSVTINDPSTVVLNADGNTLTVVNSVIVNTAANVTLNAPIAGTASITNSGTGTLTLGGINTYTGATTVSAGTLMAGAATSAFGIGSAVTVNAGAKLDLNGFNNTVGSITGAGNIDNSSATPVTLTTGSAGGTVFTGTLTNSGGGALSLTKVGAGTLDLTNSNSYTGSTNLNAGTLLVENSAALGNTGLGAVGTLIIADGTTLGTSTGNYNTTTNSAGVAVGVANPVSVNGNFTITATPAAGNFVGEFSLTGPVNLNGATRTITGTTASSRIHLGGVISNGGLTLTTSGLPAPVGGVNSYVAFLMDGTAANAYTGLTTVNNNAVLLFAGSNVNKVAGSLEIDGNGVVDYSVPGLTSQIASTATVTVNSSGSNIGTTYQGLELGGNSETIATLNGSAAGTVGLGSGTLTVSNGTFAGSIKDGALGVGGNLVVNGPGTLVLSGVNSYTGKTAISGALNLTGTLGSGGGTAITSTGSFVESSAGVIAGTSTVTIGGGTTTLAGANTYTGATTLNSGSLLFGNAKALGGGNLVVNGGTLQNMTLGGSNTPVLLNLGAGNITFNGGTITFLVGGKDGATLLHDQITTTGSMGHIGGTIALKQTNGYVLGVGDKVTLVSAAGGVAGGTASGTAVPAANVSGLSQFTNTSLVPVLNLYPTSIVLEINQGSFAALASTLSLTPNQQAVAVALDSAAASKGNQTGNIPAFQLLNSQSLQSPGSVRTNLELLSPAPLSSIFTVGSALSSLQHSNLRHHFDDLRAEAGSASSGDTTPADNTNQPGMSGPEGKGGKEVRPPRHIPSSGTDEKERWSAFLVGSGNFTHVGSTSNASGYNLDTGGVTVGVEYKIAQNLIVGIDAGYANTSTSIANGGSVGVDSGQFGIFATYFDMGYYLDAAIHGGVSGYNTRRTGLGGVATANPGGSSVSFLLAGGYDWKINALTVGPTVSLQHTNTRLDGFTETGSSLAPLTVQGHSADSTKTALGVRAFYDVNVAGIALRPELRLAWQHEFGDTSDALTSNFATLGGNAFTVNGPQVGRDSLLIGTGVTMIWSPVLSTFIAYDGEVGRSNYDSHSISGGVRFKF